MKSKFEKLITITEKVVRIIKKEKDIKAICLFGSVARGFVDRFSKDVDILVLVGEIPSKKEMEKIVKKIEGARIEIVSTKFHIIRFELDKFYVDLQFFKFSEIKKSINNFLKGEIWEYWPALINECKIIWDPRGLIKGLKKKLKPYPKKIKKKIIEDRVSNFGKFYEYMKRSIPREDKFFIYEKFYYALKDFVFVLFTLNEEYFDQLKWLNKRIEKLKIKPKNTYQRLLSIINLDFSKKSNEKKLKIFEELVNELIELIKKNCPEIKPKIRKIK